ncbi:unnamed protein product, partial [Staurois parvus]
MKSRQRRVWICYRTLSSITTRSAIFFQDGLKTADKMKQYIEKLAADLYNIKQTQDEEKKQLTALRDLIKSSLQLDQKE